MLLAYNTLTSVIYHKFLGFSSIQRPCAVLYFSFPEPYVNPSASRFPAYSNFILYPFSCGTVPQYIGLFGGLTT